jgi:hypothetical protein
MDLRLLIVLSGIGQVLLVAASLAIPRALEWRTETAKLRPLVRQIFWTYAAYILCFNLCFGLVSFFAADVLLDGSRLALYVTAFIAVYWAARVIIQFTYFDRTDAPQGPKYAAAEGALVLLFVMLTVVYSAAAVHNFRSNGVQRTVQR